MKRPLDGHAFLMGNRNLAVPLHDAGAAVTIVSAREGTARFSRFTRGWIEDSRPDEDALVASLLAHAARVATPVALFYQSDGDLLFVSRRRDDLSPYLRFTIPPASLVEQLVDKSSFQRLAERLNLPVPPSWIIELPTHSRKLTDLPLPLLIKPIRRDRSWRLASPAKAVTVSRRDQLEELLSRLADHHDRVIGQVPVPGPETLIESYHVYVDSSGQAAAEFTGRKLRTHPAAYGHSTALITTAADDVVRLGRDITARLNLKGVAKFDFKRDIDGRLWLLEINPRFNLWHHLGAAAGVSIPAVVWSDLCHRPRPPIRPLSVGVTWCQLDRDLLAARQQGMSLIRWMRWAAFCDTKGTMDPTDPMPFLVGRVLAPPYRKLRRVSSSSSEGP